MHTIPLKAPVVKESLMDGFFNSLTNQIWGLRQRTEPPPAETPVTVSEKSLFFLVSYPSRLRDNVVPL
jgi:hypothetical protein